MLTAPRRFLTLSSSVLCGSSFFIAAAALALPPDGINGAAAQAAQTVLTARCVSCHGAAVQKGGLRLDSLEGALIGGGSGPAVVPGKAAASLLIRYVTGAVPGKQMPPAGPPLTATQIAALRSWIDAGAVRPNDQTKQARAMSRDVSGGAHWSFRPISRPAPPSVRNRAWPRNPIDLFVLARLEKLGIRPSPQADRPTLIRRLYLDLTGLPPGPEEVDGFVDDRAPDAYERVVDRLLASPHFGERWGRHWLDAARYADSDGYEADLPRPYAYLYRDWLIQALNRDMPFDQFTIEQLAGDLLPNATLEQKIATGFHRNTLTNREGGADPEEDRVKATVDRVSTTGTVWLGLTVGCAECHNHKYDPISQKEFYQLFAFYNAAQEADLPLEKAAEPPPEAKKGTKPAVKAAAILAQNPNPPPTHIHVRGDFLRKGEVVQPGTPAVLPPLRCDGAQPSRLDLARWLVDPANPLTPRVTVNRVWQQLFGQGLVTTPNDFGTRGDPPSHPELLDWLAAAFAADRVPERRGDRANSTATLSPSLSRSVSQSAYGCAWSVKSLLRLIVTSETYRQSSRIRPELADRDPRNVLLARQSRFRVEAETVRDLYLSASGLLNPAIGGPSIRPPLPADIAALGYAGSVKWPESTGPERFRRGMYIFYQRTVPYPMLATFDAPESNVTCTRRERSNTPLQALTLLNDPVFFECAQALGRRIASRPGDPAGRLRYGFRLCLGREPSQSEVGRLLRLFEETRAVYERDPAQASKAGGSPMAGTDAADTAAYVAAARTILNLDEFVTRE